MSRPYSVRGWSRLGFVFAAVLGLVLVSAPMAVQAQEGGTVVGTVTDAQSGRPLSGAQVFVPNSGIGALANSSGRFLLFNVPVGEQTIRAELVGYRSVSQTVNVVADESVQADFALSQTAIALDEIVVTGAGVATQKKRLGNTIATIDLSSLENAPVSNFSDLIQGREPGLVGLPSSGTTGEGARIRIRGSASLSQSNEPIVYVDGIRVDNSGGFGENVSAGGQGSPSRLDDIPPHAIERIEVLKGAAAATLYGTEASNGVIQIFTKQGIRGEPRWSFQIDQTAISTPTGRMIPVADYARDQEQVDRMRQRFGVSLQPYEVFEYDVLPEFFTTGYQQAYSGSVRGGSDQVRYFISGRYQSEDGPFELDGGGPANDENTRRQATANLTIFPHDQVRIRISSLYSETEHMTPSNSNNIFGTFSSAMMAQLRYAEEGNRYGAPAFGTSREFTNEILTQNSEHFAGSVNLNYQVSDNLNLDGTFGIDISNQQNVDFYPFGWNVDDFTTYYTEGSRVIGDRNFREVTGDFKLSWNRNFGESWSSQFLTGAQGFINQAIQTGGTANDFPGPGLEVAEAGAVQSITESFIRNVNAGFYAQEQLGFNNWIYTTLGARWDANSAFGENLEGVIYPKASISVIPTDRFNWEGSTLSTLRLRAAIGQSGLQPSSFAKFTSFAPLASVEGPGLAPDNLGNQDLEPEVSTEWELGAELGLFNDRAAVDVTYWNRTVSDALVARQFPVTGGFRATQLDNIGEVKGSGLEISVNGNAVARRDFSLDFFANAAYLSEEITDMGGAPPLKTGGSYSRYRNYLREGYAPGAFFGAELDRSMEIPLDLNGNCSEPSQAQALEYFSEPRDPSEFEVIPLNCGGDFLGTYLGKPTPDWQGSFGFNLNFLDNFELSSLFEFKGGDYKVQDLSGMFRRAHSFIGRNTPDAARADATMQDPSSTAQERLEAAQYWARNLRGLAPMAGMNGIYDASWIRWRELSLTWRVPDELTQSFRLDNAAVTLGVRNLKLWVNDDYPGLDPEINIVGRCTGSEEQLTNPALDCLFLDSVEGWGMPIPRRFTLSLKFGF